MIPFDTVLDLAHWRARQRVPPSRSAAIVYMLEHFLKRDPPTNL